METIYIKGLEIFAYHGVNPEEKTEGQLFILDIKLKADLSAARESGVLSDTINYAAVRKAVNRVFTAEKHDLIEKAAHEVCLALLREFKKIDKVTVKLKKPQAPMNARFDYVAVKVTEKRKKA